MRAPPDRIPAPAFLTHLRWVNVKSLRIERQQGRPVLIEFWDFCRPNSLRTLPYLRAWYERYGPDGAGDGDDGGVGDGEDGGDDGGAGDADDVGTGGKDAGRDRAAGGLQVVGIHSPGFPPGRDRAAAKAAVARLGIEYPVLLDPDLEMWQEYENQGWPARYLFDGRGSLFDYHYGEGAYEETELAIQELLGVRREPVAPLRAEDAPDARVAPQTEDQPGPYSGPYEAGAVWAVLDGAGKLGVNGAELDVTYPGARLLVEHERHTEGVLELEVGEGVECLATCFTPGVA